jgi:hypothetical protein
MSIQEIPDIKDALNEYYKLKNQFETQNNIYKKKIMNNSSLSKKEKRSEFLKIMPKCVNCKRPSKKGTIFSIIYHPADDKTADYRKFKILCGNLADPCNLHIEFIVGNRDQIDEMLNSIREEIKKIKNKIIDDKNKLLFGLITTETALENFDNNKNYISELTSVYESYLDLWNKEIDDPQKKIELEETLVQFYQNVNSIKECIAKMNQLNDPQFAVDAVNIYHNVLDPILKKIRHLKYKENSVYDSDNNTCNLIQRKYNIDDILVSSYSDKIISYNIGLKLKKSKPNLIIESESIEKTPKELTIKIKGPDEIPMDEPIIGEGEDGIAWNIPEYQNLWDKLPPKLKTEFKLNIEWMKDFMYKCVKEREKEHGESCKLTTPSNLIVPPKQLQNGQYDFGVSIYNKAFNSQPQSLQKTYLTFYKEDPTTKEKNYNMLINAMNSLVEREVDFGKGFF